MAIVYEVIRKLNEMRKTYGYDFNIPNIYGIADFRRNEFVFIAKKAIREVINKYKRSLIKHRISELTQCLNKAIMNLYTKPELIDYFDSKCQKIFDEILLVKVGYGYEAWGLSPWGSPSKGYGLLRWGLDKWGSPTYIA